MSRIYGGIHFMHDNIEGNKIGTKIGLYTIEKLKMKK